MLQCPRRCPILAPLLLVIACGGVPGKVWTSASGQFTFMFATIGTAEGCKPGTVDHLYDAAFVADHLRLADEDGAILKVGSWGPFHAEIGRSVCSR
jgi:hypothetical protein